MDNYDNNYYETDPGQNRRETKKKGHTALFIILSLVLVLSLTSGLFYIVKSASNKIIEAVKEAAADSSKEDTKKGEIDNKDNKADDATQSPSEQSSETTKLLKSETDISSATISSGVILMDVSEIVENVLPCVVAITDNLEVSYNPYNRMFNGSSTQESVASGSGVIIGKNETELLIVTNNHVVDNEGNYSYYSISSTGVSVAFCDGSTASATVKGTDSDMDLAVIAVKLSDLSTETKDSIKIAVIGDSDALKVGAGVIAIGNAMGYGQSVTVGVLSAKNREVTIDNITRKLLQTDAAINPGNSGGGLFDANGRLIGINSAKTVDTEIEGMCFAIPISNAADIIEELMNKETIASEDMGYLGINGETVPTTYINNYGYPAGVSVTRIAEKSKAEASGLQIYDIITAINGKSISSMNELKKQTNSYKAGTVITLTVMRPEGRSFKQITIEAELMRYSDLVSDSSTGDSGEKSADSEENGNQYSDIDNLFDWFWEQFSGGSGR